MKIYKIVTPHSEKCYVGKTTQKIGYRLHGHRAGLRQWLDGTAHWCSSYGLLWLGDCSIELLEETEDDQAERKWIAQLDCVNRCRMEYGSGDQYDKTAYDRDLYLVNGEKKRANASKRYKEKSEEIKAYAKRYVAANHEKVTADKRAYYLKNKEDLNAKRAERVICDRCGTEGRMGDMHRHQRSKKCQTLYAAKCEK